MEKAKERGEKGWSGHLRSPAPASLFPILPPAGRGCIAYPARLAVPFRPISQPLASVQALPAHAPWYPVVPPAMTGSLCRLKRGIADSRIGLAAAFTPSSRLQVSRSPAGRGGLPKFVEASQWRHWARHERITACTLARPLVGLSLSLRVAIYFFSCLRRRVRWLTVP